MIWNKDADCIFVPSQISSTARYLIFDFSRCPGIKIPQVDTAEYIAYVGYIKEPIGRYLAFVTRTHKWCIYGNAGKNLCEEKHHEGLVEVTVM